MAPETIIGRVDQVDAAPPLETCIAGSTDKEIIEKAVTAWETALAEFIFPPELESEPRLAGLLAIQEIVEARIREASGKAVEIIQDLNERMDLLHNPNSRFRELARKDEEQWTEGQDATVLFGTRTCVDSGVTREAVGGLTEPNGRTLGGDDRIVFVPHRKRFELQGTLISKKLTHVGLSGLRTGMEVIIEHTHCGRRMQMINNLNAQNEISHLARLITDNLQVLASEFSAPDAKAQLAQLAQLWSVKTDQNLPFLTQDRGLWLGTIMKIAQRQAYKGLHESAGLSLVVPIELYDKYDGNVLTGLDSLDALAHPTVTRTGGFTDEALAELIDAGIVFSLKHAVHNLESSAELDLGAELHIQKGSRTFEEVQTDWLPALDDRVTITENLWRMYRDSDQKYNAIRSMVDAFVRRSTQEIQGTWDSIESDNETGTTQSRLLRNRLIHQLFQALAYAWQQDTFSQGHKAGDHLETYIATGESGYTGLKRHIALGQGDLSEPTAQEIYTGRSVLLHSHLVEEDEPVVALLKNDTSREATREMSSEETRPAMRNFAEVLRLWPYVLVGDIVPFVVIKGEPDKGAISRIARTVLKTYGDVLRADATPGLLPDAVPAGTSSGEVVYVAAHDVLQAGISAQGDLQHFRHLVQQLADSVASPVYQRNLP